MLGKSFYSEFGRGKKISKIALGTVKFGRNQQVKYPVEFEIPDNKKIENLLLLAKNSGINSLDTAPAYGLAEKRIGEILNKDTDNWIIGTKVGEVFQNGQSFFDFTYDTTIKSIDNSLNNLRRNNLDYVLLHSDGNDSKALQSAACEVLFKLRSLGVINKIGISCKTSAGFIEAINLGCDIIMIELNLNCISNRQLCLLAEKNNIKVLVKKALNSGHANVLNTFNWLASESSITSIVLGTISSDHLEQNLSIYKDALYGK
jgi:aryl-alcohol dehydrogenase-like predicted oxidoreductase